MDKITTAFKEMVDEKRKTQVSPVAIYFIPQQFMCECGYFLCQDSINHQEHYCVVFCQNPHCKGYHVNLKVDFPQVFPVLLKEGQR